MKLKSKSGSLTDIISSRGGIHLSLYLNESNQDKRVEQFDRFIKKSTHLLHGKTSPRALVEFYKPIHQLRNKELIQLKPNETLIVFRSAEHIKVIRSTHHFNSNMIVANSFHVKPFIESLQFMRRFLILNYQENQKVFLFDENKIVKVVEDLSDPLISSANTKSVHNLEYMIANLQRKYRLPIYIACSREDRPAVIELLLRIKNKPQILNSCLNRNSFSVIVNEAKKIQTRKNLIEHKRKLREFDDYLANYNLQEIAYAACRGNIKKILIASDFNIFGKVEKNGSIRIHNEQVNHQDDDILDDIAQQVISNGGEVVVDKISNFPVLKPAVAILSRSEPIELTLEPGKHRHFAFQQAV